jgi:hypothetical protein
MRNKWKISCPYCDHNFDTLPPDRTGCPNCEQIIYIYSSPLGGQKILMTEEGLFKVIRTKSSKEEKDYFVARMEELEAAFRKATASTTHYAELGRELETLVKKLLEEYLPNKYKVATGFVKSLEKPGWQSNQIDIILSRSDICYPISVQHQYSVFPIESVVSFMEVTSNLTPAKLHEDYEKVAELQRLSNRLFYIPDPPAGIKAYSVTENAVHPRFYYFAFETTCSMELITQTLLELSNEYRIQLHALYILRPSACFIMPNAIPNEENPYQQIFQESNPRNAIVAFLQHVLVSLQTADFIPPNASIPFGEYFKGNTE